MRVTIIKANNLAQNDKKNGPKGANSMPRCENWHEIVFDWSWAVGSDSLISIVEKPRRRRLRFLRFYFCHERKTFFFMLTCFKKHLFHLNIG